MDRSDWIAICAFLVAVASALYTKHQGDAARHANRIARFGLVRSDRMAIYRAMDQFCKYCASYLTLMHIGLVRRSEGLVEAIDRLKLEFSSYGPLGMADVEQLWIEMERRAWRMQRLVDRIAGGQQTPHDPGFATADENLEALMDWFSAQKQAMPKLFEQYLTPPE